MNNKLKITILPALLLSLLIGGNVAMASEVTGNLSTGINSTVGNTVEGVVIVSPTASPVAGTYTSAQSVALTASGSSSIHYSVNGTNPTCSTGSVYSSPISINSTQTIKAISCYSGNGSSSVASFAYTLTLVAGGGANVSLGSVTAGQAELPTGATSIVLTNTTVLDLSAGLSGNAVTLQSGVDGQPVILTNSNLAGISASIPDGTKIQGPAGWDGKITPPISGTPSGGNAPAGFSVGSTVISIGSPDGTLVFDSPVTILLAGVTGAVGYRPSGSNTWVQITNACSGTYATPTPPTSPGECAKSNGTDTKIVTYHFTTFGSLTTNPAPVSSGSSGSGGGVSTPSTPASTLSAAAQKVDANKDNKIDVLDFNSLMVNWGKTGTGNVADFDGNGKVDVFDFNLLMINWTL